MRASIDQIQEEIVSEYAVLAEDLEMTLHYLMDEGKKLPALSAEEQKDAHLVRGCQSRVWLLAECRKGYMYYRAQSDAAITRGLVSLLLRVFDGQSAEDVLRSRLVFPDRIHMERFIGTQRSGGFLLMSVQIKKHAAEALSNFKSTL